ncbi:MAG: serine/threonine protein kinase, partial [Myxococcales bacterium]|nr:serine/threonine protein kinase [Myxococcales bacterium]
MHGHESVASGASATNGIVVVVADEPPPQRRLGRYVVLDRLGTGGMGAVYVAYDPELDRRVAIKVLRADRARSDRAEVNRLRLAQEAKTLAQLNHPNIVRVFDVGMVDGRMFIAMELLEGENLRRWWKAVPRSVEEILAVFVAAAEGLAAAHDAGIVHRDFKPDNVVVCGDGRTVVLDFGIARGAELDSGVHDVRGEAETPSPTTRPLTNPGRAMGTPAYMAPEQHLGGVLDGRSDQYSWCIALWEALGGARPFGGRATTMLQKKVTAVFDMPADTTALPAWLLPVLRRGLSPRAESRYGSMREICEAVAAARPRRRGRRVLRLAAVAGLGAAGLFAAASADAGDPCPAGERRLGAMWSGARGDMIGRHFEDSGVAYAPGTWALVRPRLDAYALRWADGWRTSCEAARQGDRASERTMACLDAQLEVLGARLEVLGAATPETIENSSRLVAELPSPQRCEAPVSEPGLAEIDATTREQVTEVRGELAAVEDLELAGRYADGLERGLAALDHAMRVGYAPALAEALFLVGRMHKALGRYPEAARVLTDAAWTATAADHDEIAARAMTDLVIVVGRELSDAAAGHVWANNAEAAIARAGGDELLEAGLLSGVGLLQFREGQFDEARRGDELALEIRARLLGREHPLVAASHNNLGSDLWMLGRYGDAEAQLREAIAIHEAIAGPDHPRLAASLDNLGALLAESGDHAQARPLIERALRIRERALSPNHPSLADTLVNLGALHVALSDDDGALALFERARDIIERGSGPDHPSMATCLSNLGGVQLDRGDYDAAEASYTRALDIYAHNLGDDHVKVGLTLANLGEVQRLRGRLGEAAVSLARAVDLVEAGLGPEHPRLAFPVGRLGLTRLEQGDAAEAVVLLGRALDLGRDVDVVAGARGTLQFARARARLGSGGDVELARAEATQARSVASGAALRREIDRFLAR